MDPWNPAQYDRFAEERRQPLLDLLDGVRPCPGGTVLDLGCGTGDTTVLVHERLGARETLGIDSSAAMLARSGSLARPGLSFLQADIASYSPATKADVVFSNAALHWLDGHEQLFAHLVAWVAPGGQLAVQMPSNHEHPSSQIAIEVAALEPFRQALGGYSRRSPLLTPSAYARLLFDLGTVQRRVRLEQYGHVLSSRDDVVEWVKGTTLTDYQGRLPAALWPSFLDRYRERLAAALPDERPFFFPFARVLLWATIPRG